MTKSSRLSRIAFLALATVALSSAWTMSVEFPYTALPRPVWERALAQLKEMGVAHVSLPHSDDAAQINDRQLDEVIHIIRRLGLDADLEGPVPDRLQPLMKVHGGPLTDVLPVSVRISATMARALDNERKLLTSGTQAVIWTDVFETLTPYHSGAITLAGAEGPAAALVRREAQLARFWGTQLVGLPEAPGARLSIPVDSVAVHQYISDKSNSALPDAGPPGLSLATVVNDSSKDWKGEVRVMYPPAQRPILLANVTLAPHDVLWLPVNIPLVAGPMCSGCTGFAPSDDLAFATAELTAMEYENGVLAMEFIAPTAGEVVLQLSREPTGPLLAAGHPGTFEWEPKTQRVRLPIPAGNAKTGGRVRVALAIDAPAATAFFDSATVLLAGETNHLTAQFSPPAVAGRSRLRTPPELTTTQDDVVQGAEKEQPSHITYGIAVPATTVPGDTAQIAIEADGSQLSHLRLRVTPPVAVTFEDAVAVRVAADSFVRLSPTTIPMNQKSGREIVFSLRNNAPEIRTFEVALHVPGLDFSPAKQTVSVGASVARDVTFRVFGAAAAGIHAGEVRVSGAAQLVEPVRFVVLPTAGAVAWSGEGFSILESTKSRASFLANKWLEMIDKDAGHDLQPAGGTDFNGSSVESLKLTDLEKLAAARNGR